MRPTIFLAFAACTGDQYNYQGTPIYDYFPLDGKERSWTYSQDDDSIQYFLFIEMVPPGRTTEDGTEVVTLETTESKNKSLVATTEWSSDSRDGVMIHSYAVGTDAATAFDPPVVFAAAEMAADETVETTNASGTFAATFIGLQDCPNHWVPGTDSDPWSCAHMKLEGPGLGFEGDYWIAPRYGTALFQRIQDPDKWNLLEAIWEPE